MDDSLVPVVMKPTKSAKGVLILVVVDDSLVPYKKTRSRGREAVLILVVVDDSLVPTMIQYYLADKES